MVLLTSLAITQVLVDVMKTYPWTHDVQVTEVVQDEQGKVHL